MTIKAELLAHSAYKVGNELRKIASLKLLYPRFIHAEFMTHREFSRSASSSRAIPVDRIISQVEKGIAFPVEWGSNRPGMQAGPEIPGMASAHREWEMAAHDAIYRARRMKELGLHKQVINRVLEPYAHISVIVTSTQWQNFMSLRISEFSDPTMRALAEAMQEALASEPPRLMEPGDWHLPFVRGGAGGEAEVMQSAAMCARVSYLRHDGEPPSREENEALAARLLQDRHMSPFEHQARPARGRFYNLRGWRSFRFDLENPQSEYVSPVKKIVQKIVKKKPVDDWAFDPDWRIRAGNNGRCGGSDA